MSRNMFCSQYDDMNNGVYYHFGQSLVDPPYVEHETLIGNSTINNEIFIKDDRVSINAYQATDQIIVNSEFISSEVLWYGSLLNIGVIVNISNLESYNNLSANESYTIFFIFSNECGEGNINVILRGYNKYYHAYQCSEFTKNVLKYGYDNITSTEIKKHGICFNEYSINNGYNQYCRDIKRFNNKQEMLGFVIGYNQAIINLK